MGCCASASWRWELQARAALAASANAAVVVDSGALRADVSADPWGLRLVDGSGEIVLAEDPSTGAGSAGTLGFQSGGVWHHATRVLNSSTGDGYAAELATNDPGGRRISLRLRPTAEGVIGLDAEIVGAGPPVEAFGMGFGAGADERYLGFGERSQAVDQRGNVVENYVSDGPYQPDEWGLIQTIVPPWGFRPRTDATYYPVPWLLSTAGYGVLVDSPETSYFQLDKAGSWSVELVNAPPDELPAGGAPPPRTFSLSFFAGPEPADVLERFTDVTGRQPPAAAPWVFGPWVQPTGGTDEQLALLDQLQQADAPLSLAQTYLHYLPCGSQRGRREEERQRTAGVHGLGLAITTYLNPMVCTDYEPVFGEAAANGGLIENAAGEPYLFQYSTTNTFEVAEFDFTAAAGRAAYDSVADEAIEDGHDGWMEDFGEYTPLDSQTAAGEPGVRIHNPYPREYHCGGAEAIADAPRPVVRFQRSGWTRAAPCAQVVWGGDPTTAWDFDGLRSAVRQGLTMGLSGISTWGSDIGGFFAFFQDELTPELLIRWVQFGAVSGVMRTQADGIAVPEKPRPQVWDPDQIANWRRYTKLRTQLYPYVAAADAAYQASGMPIMRHLALRYPDDPVAAGHDDEFLFGPDLLAAPVVEPGATERAVYLPRGRWVDLWRSAQYRDRRWVPAAAPREGVAGCGRGDPAGAARGAAAARPRRHGSADAAAGRRHAQRLSGRLDDLALRQRGSAGAARPPARQELGFDVRGRADPLARTGPGMGAADQGRAAADVSAAGVAEDAVESVRAVPGERRRRTARAVEVGLRPQAARGDREVQGTERAGGGAAALRLTGPRLSRTSSASGRGRPRGCAPRSRGARAAACPGR